MDPEMGETCEVKPVRINGTDRRTLIHHGWRDNTVTVEAYDYRGRIMFSVTVQGRCRNDAVRAFNAAAKAIGMAAE